MVMSEVACLVQSPHQANHANGETGIAGSALRRPRNREVTSRYKSPCSQSVVSPATNRRFPTPNADRSKNEPSTASPAPVPIRRFPTPNVDRSAHASDVPSSKRAVSVERRRPSPSRTAEHGSCKASNDATAPVPPRRTSVRAELLWPSTRSLTSSMQLESVPLPPSGQPRKQIENRGKCSNVIVDQTLKPSANVVQKPVNTRRPTPERKATPLRCQNIDQAENARPQENLQKHKQHNRPESSNVKMSGAALGRSIDLSNDRERLSSKAATLLVQEKQANGSSSVSHNLGLSGARSLSVNEGLTLSSSSLKPRPQSRGRRRDSPSRSSRAPNSPLLSGNGPNKSSPPSVTSHIAVDQVVNPARLIGQAVELANSDVPAVPDNASDSESVSSGGTTTTSSSGRGTPGSVSVYRGVRGMNVPARVWQDAANRSKRLPESKLRSSMPESEFAAASSGRASVRCKTVESPQASHSLQSGSASSSPWSSTMSIRSGSSFLPSQQPLSPSRVSPYRNIPSPLRSRGGQSLSSGGQRSSSTAMMLNFGADVRRGRKGLSLMEEIHLHRILHNRLLQWRFVNARADGAMDEQTAGAEKMLYNVCVRIFDLRSSVLAKKVQLHQARQTQRLDALLSRLVHLQGDHLNALEGAVRALEAAILRVPLTGGVKADIPALQDAISSAFDVMNLIENSAAYLLPKADKTICLVSELGHVAAQERVLLDECASLLATASALEVEERSIRTQLVQCQHERARVLGHLMDTTSSLPESAVV
ncbi:hypothetical protein L7F22_057581 [Adiantum nelumboides]|nr:hypothetical protein [Adiantum nelumboides]